MPVATIQLDDGRIVKVEVPQGATPDQINSFVSQNIDSFKAPEPKKDEFDNSQLSPRAREELTIEQQKALLETKRKQQSIAGAGAIDSSVPSASTDRANKMEALMKENPFLAKMIDEMNPLEKAAVGFQQGLRTAARGAGKLVGQDFFPDVNDPALQTLQDVSGAATAGKIAGEAAPFLAAAPATGTVGTGLSLTKGGQKLVPAIQNAAGRGASTSALGASEAASIAAGEDRSGAEIGQAALLGGALGLGAEVAAPVANRLRRSVADSKRLLREPTEKEVRDGIARAAPQPEQLRDAAKNIYQDVKELGVEFKPESFRSFLNQTIEEANELGLDIPQQGRSLTPESATVFNRLEGLLQGPVSVEDLEKARRTAQNAASVAFRAGNNADGTINSSVVDSIDEFLTKVNPSDFRGGDVSVGQELATARNLWGRARKSELLNEAVEEAAQQASGLENGIRIGFRKILRNKKQKNFFTKAEREAMNTVVEGTTTANTFKRLGKMGFGSGQQTNVLGGLVSSGVGASTLSTMFGPLGAGIGAVLLPTVGTVSKNLAENLTKKNAALANQVVRAGSNADAIARAYLRNTPRKQQSAEDLSQLLMRPDVDLSKFKFKAPIAQDAIDRAKTQRAAVTTALGATAVAAQGEEDDNE